MRRLKNFSGFNLNLSHGPAFLTLSRGLIFIKAPAPFGLPAYGAIFLSVGLLTKENSMLGIVKFWHAEKQFGFAVTEDGQEFYVSVSRFTRPAARSGQLHWANLEGKRIRFDRATKSPDAAWTRMLNDGTLRDTDGIDTRNPRPPRPPRAKPVAVNVVVIEEKS